MFFEANKSIMYSDTLVPDIFINEYMPSMDGDYVKIYIHCLFLSKHNKFAAVKDLAKKLDIDINKVKDGLIYLESLGIITRKETNSNSIVLLDIKEKEINKLYRLKATSTPEEAIHSSERNKKRNEIITVIKNKFFQGLMSPSWYTDIDSWFDRYQFEEDVMFALFQYCYDHNGLTKNYITKVAESWNNKGIKNSFDLDNYSMEYQNFKDIKSKIIKKLKLSRNLTEYEDKFVEKWISEYKFDFPLIELCLKKTTAKTNPNFNFLDSVITEWNSKGLKTEEEILTYEKSKRQNYTKADYKQRAIPQHSNFEQREYDENYYNSFYKNSSK
jgi:DnaD/phage-associated family protein